MIDHYAEFENGDIIGTIDAAAGLHTPTRTHEDFPFEKVGSFKDEIRQRLRDGESFEGILKSLAVEELEILIADRLAAFIAIIRTAKKPIFFLDCLWMASGAALREGEEISRVRLAKTHGCSKQAIAQGVQRVKKQYFAGDAKTKRKSRNERSEAARKSMAKANFSGFSAAHFKGKTV